MGLLLSTLVFCVGVVELITFYRNVRRRVEYPSSRGSLSHIRESYIQELRGIRRTLIEDLERLKEASEGAISYDDEISRSVPTFRLNSHEDIEIEYSKAITRSKSPSPRRFLVTEKEQQNETEKSCRRFVVSEEPPQTIRKSNSQSSLPEFLIREENSSEKSPNKPRYVLQEQHGEHPIPLPKQFIVAEPELNTVIYKGSTTQIESSNTVEYIRRSPSPFPSLEAIHRNSLCTDVIECSSLDAVEEEQKSRSNSPNSVIENIPPQANYVSISNAAGIVTAKCIATSSCINESKFLKPIVPERIRSKSESDNSTPNSSRTLNAQSKASSNSKLENCSNVRSNLEIELEEAFKENSPGNKRIKQKNVSSDGIGIIFEKHQTGF